MNFKPYLQCRILKLQHLLLLFFIIQATFALAQTYHGRVGVGVSLGSWNLPFVDVAKTARSYTKPDGSAVAKDALGWPMADAQTVLMDMRPPTEWVGSIDDPEQFRLDVSGTYKCSFTGQARVVKIEGPFSLGPVSYNEATNTSTFDLTIDPPTAHHGVVIIQFLDTKRTPTSAMNSGFTNFKAIRPGYDPNTTQVFTNELLRGITNVDFSTIRTMGGTRTNDNKKFYPEYYEWSERKTMNAATWEDDNVGQENAMPWEVIVDLANLTNTDLWMNVRHDASDNYMRELATFIKNRLKPDLTLYVEYSNEVWNWSFPQSWFNDAKAKAEGLNHIKGYSKRTVEMAKIFESVFGAGSLNNKVRVINAWQIGWNPPDAMYEEQMQYINTTFGPPKNFIYGLGVAPYFNCGSACETGTVQQIIDEMRRSSDASKLDRQKIVAVASKWQIPGGMVAYEGGSDTGGGSVTNIANKIGAERSTAIREIFLRDMRQNWFDIGGGLFVYLELASSYNRYGSWGLTDDIRNLDRNSKFGAVRDLVGTAATAAPEAPLGLTATPVGNANIALSWTASSSALSYKIKRSTTSGGPFTVVGTTAATSFSDNTVTIGTTYYYVVSAVNSIGEGVNSAEVSVVPTELKTIAREYWSNVGGTAVSAIPVGTRPTGVDELTSLESAVNIGDSYGARIRAYLKPTVSGNYTFYIASDDNSQLFLSTNKLPANKVKIAEVTDWTGYKEWTKSGTQTSGVKSLVAGQEYYIEILHKEGSGGDHVEVGWTGPGISAISIIGMANLARFDGQDTPPAGPDAPTGLVATRGNASATLSWNAVAGATSYNIKRHTGGNFNTVATGITTTTYQDNNLVNGTTYFYAVTAVNANGESNISNTAQVTPASSGGGGGQTGTLASWDFAGSTGQTSVATTTAMTGISTTAPSLVASLASGLEAVGWINNSLIGIGQTATTLEGAITANDYISFTVTPEAGRSISISSVKVRPLSQHNTRTFVLMSNVGGFAAGNEISTFTVSSQNSEILNNIPVTGHSNIGNAVEFRLYVFGHTSEWEFVGIGNRHSSLAEADLIVEGSLSTASTTVAVTGVSVSPTSASLSVGGTQQLTATVSPANATNKNVSWSSSNTSVATVNATGLVTAVAAGSATITVTTQDGAKTATTAVTVPVVETPDTQAPTAPSNLLTSGITTSSFTLSWAAATDNVGVTAYKVYNNDVLVATITNNINAQITGLSPQTAYSIKVVAEDAAGNKTPSQVLTVTTQALPAPLTITREVWSNITGRGIAGIPVNTPPTSTTVVTKLEGPTDVADNYGARIRAYITPTVSGYYTFYIAGDDAAELWLSVNDNPAQATKIAEVTKAVKPYEWNKNRGQKSIEKRLIAGTKYYVEVLHRETSGRDHVAVGWTGPGIRTVTVIGGSVLSPFGTGGPTTPATTYALTVSSGLGAGSFVGGAVVNISANAAPAGKVFDAWTGSVATVANVNAASTTITMPAAATSVTATYKDVTYTLTVTDGSGQGSYKQGSVVNISAIVPEGFIFSQWTGDIATVADIKAASTTITMPAANATVSATFIRPITNDMPTLNLGMNLNSAVYYGKQNAFKNMAKQSSTFLTSYPGGPWNTEEIQNIPADINGYPLELPYNGNVFIHCILPFYYPEGRYVLTYDGEGEVTMNLNAKVVSSTPGRLVFDYRNNDNGGLGEYKIVRSTRGNHVRNIVIVPISMEGQDILTNPFRDDFLEYLKPLQAIRYMGFMHVNGAREQEEWTDRSLVGDYTYQSGDMGEDKYLETKGLGGVPIEVCVQLNNILQKDAWFCVPHPASDDYIRQYARLVKEKLDPNLKTYIEYSNEVWNWGWGFPQSQYIINNAPGHPNAYVSSDLAAISPRTDMHPEKDAYMIGRTMRLWTEEWSGQLNRLVRVAAVQHGWVDNTRRILEYLQTNNQLQLVDAVSPAGYFGLKWDIRDRLKAKGAALTYQEVVDGVIETFETDEKPNTLAQAAYARQFGKSYVAYEGGSHVDYRGDDTERLKQLIKQFDDSQEVYDMYKRNFQLHVSPEVDCKLFIALAYVGEPGGFGHLEYLGEPLENAPKYRALVEASPGTYVPSYPATASSSTQARALYEEENNVKGIGIYPNPASNRVFIALNAAEPEKVEVVVKSLAGATVKTTQRSSAAEDVIELDTSNLKEGMYIISVQKGKVITNHKMIIKR